MTDYKANVTPDQPWNEDGTAEVQPLAPHPPTSPRTLPLENRPVEDTTVSRTSYPDGLVVIKEDDPPTGSPATLVMRESTGNTITVLEGEIQEWPNGFVAWFSD